MSFSSFPEAKTSRFSGWAKQKRSRRSLLPVTYRLFVGSSVVIWLGGGGAGGGGVGGQTLDGDVPQELLWTRAPAVWAASSARKRSPASDPWKTMWQAGAMPRTRPAEPVPSPAIVPVTWVPCGPPFAALS